MAKLNQNMSNMKIFKYILSFVIGSGIIFIANYIDIYYHYYYIYLNNGGFVRTVPLVQCDFLSGWISVIFILSILSCYFLTKRNIGLTLWFSAGVVATLCLGFYIVTQNCRFM